MARNVAFAVPGALETRTGGYIYDRTLIAALREAGWTLDHLALPASFPDPTAEDDACVLSMLAELPRGTPVIIDGLAGGAMSPEAFQALRGPYVALVHHPLALETGLSPDRSAFLFRRERENLTRAARILVTSPHTADVLAESYGVSPTRILVAQPGVRRPTAAAGDRPQVPEILSVGLLAPRKGHDVLLRALAAISDLDWTARIVGRAHDPAEADDLLALRDSLGLTRRVDFTGELDEDHLDRLFGRASLFALATRYEGYGMVFAEALVLGVPIVSCRVGAVPGTVPCCAGLLVPPDDPEAFAAALRTVLTDAARREKMAGNARQHGASLPTWADTARMVGDVLDGLDR